MKITNEIIESYDPCEDGMLDFNNKYPNYNDTLDNLLKLENISYDNKMWLVCRTVNVKILQQWAIECAEMVLDNFNKVFPEDNRINECIRITKGYLLGENTLDELYNAYSAAYSAAKSAYSAENSAYSAVYSAKSAYSAAYSAAKSAYSTYSAEYSAKSAYSAANSTSCSEQEDINLSILIALLENEK